MRKGMKKCEVSTEYQPPEFKRALEILDACAAEGWFHGELDCDYCPARKSCIKFWDNFVVNFDSKTDHYSEVIAHKFKELLDKKHGYEDIWIQKLLPASTCHCERSEESHYEPFASCHSEGERRPKNLLSLEGNSLSTRWRGSG